MTLRPQSSNLPTIESLADAAVLGGLRKRVDWELIEKQMRILDMRRNDLEEAVGHCRRAPTFDTGTDVCVATRTLWFAILSMANTCRELLNTDILDALTESFRSAKAGAALVTEFNAHAEYSLEAQREIMESVGHSIGAREASIEVLANYGSIESFTNVGIHGPAHRHPEPHASQPTG